MSIWWLLWFVLSFILLGTTAWSMAILYKQKKAWSKYAKDKSLVFNKGKLSGPCTMEGTLDGFNVSFFTAVQQKEDSRKNRQLTVMQFILPKPFIDSFAAGTDEMLPFLNSMEALSPHSVESDKWDEKSNHMYSRNKEAVDAFLTEDRINILNNILKVKNSDNIILLNEEEGLFRYETSNPMTDAVTIDKLVSKLITHIKKIKPTAKELASYKKLYKKEQAKAAQKAALESVQEESDEED